MLPSTESWVAAGGASGAGGSLDALPPTYRRTPRQRASSPQFQAAIEGLDLDEHATADSDDRFVEAVLIGKCGDRLLISLCRLTALSS